jgi:hypothetical protein
MMVLETKAKAKARTKKATDISEENYVFVRYSEIMDLRQKLSDASRVMSNLAASLVNTKWMSMRPEAREGLSQKLTGQSVTLTPNTLSAIEDLGKGEYSNLTGKILKSIDSPLTDSKHGRKRKSQRK